MHTSYLDPSYILKYIQKYATFVVCVGMHTKVRTTTFQEIKATLINENSCILII